MSSSQFRIIPQGRLGFKDAEAGLEQPALLSAYFLAPFFVKIETFDPLFNHYKIGKDHVGFKVDEIVSRVWRLSASLVKVSHHVNQCITGADFIPKALITLPILAVSLCAIWK